MLIYREAREELPPPRVRVGMLSSRAAKKLYDTMKKTFHQIRLSVHTLEREENGKSGPNLKAGIRVAYRPVSGLPSSGLPAT
jgi:hypothetical protein